MFQGSKDLLSAFRAHGVSVDFDAAWKRRVEGVIDRRQVQGVLHFS